MSEPLVVVDYGAGNVQSVLNALDAIGVAAELTDDPAVILRAPGLIVPGVGAAQDTMSNLASRGLVEVIRDSIAAAKPFLGICMGMQALMTWSEEHTGQACLDIVPGRCVRFETDLPVPHMGWNSLSFTGAHPLFAGIPDGSYFYFVHSFYCIPDDPSVVLATTDYDGDVAAAIGCDNLTAVQFHPEKSGDAGLRLLANFANFVHERSALC